MAFVDIVVMAAGKGTRMKSSIPKVLHRLAGRPLLGHVLNTAAQLAPRGVVVVTGHGAEAVDSFVQSQEIAQSAAALRCVRQEPQLGTGHAVQQAVPHLPDDGMALVLNGDVPLIEASTLQALLADAAGGRLALLTVDMPDPSGYGRIVRAGDAVQRIVEHKDATPEQRAIREIYTGVMAVPAARLKAWLARLTNDNAQGEYYLTDIVAMAVADGTGVVATKTTDKVQVDGVNSPVQLAELERAWQQRNAVRLMEQGVRLADPARIDVRGTLTCGADVEIDVNCVFEGGVTLGAGVRIGANCVIAQAHIAAGAVIHPFSHIEGGKAAAEQVQVGAGALVGPVRAAAAWRTVGRGGAHRQLRGGQELHAGQGRQGQPPGLPGRCQRGRAGELRRRQHHRQLRRRQQAPDRDRGRRARGQQLRAGGPGHRGRGRHRGRRIHHHQGRAGRRIGGGAWAPGRHRRLEAAHQTGQVRDGVSAPPDADAATLRQLLARREQELAAAHADAEDLARMVSHDLRAPLRHVLAYGGLLREMLAGGEDPGMALDTLERSSRQLGDMLDAVVELARLARVPLQPGHTPGALLVEEARRALQGTVPATDLARAVDWHIATPLPAVPGDAALLRLALRQLLANALKFTRPTTAPRIEVGAVPAADGGCTLYVRDNGVGFDPARAARLFQPFARLHGAPFDGLGTGLAQVRQILRRHGGSVRAEAAPDAGCTVWITLPRA